MRSAHRPVLLAALLAAAVLLPACGSREDVSANPNVKANEAPPAAPFGINVQNLSEDNNYMKYKEVRSQEENHQDGQVTALGVKPILSERLANIVMKLDGVERADVLLSGDQAYVAVTPREGAGAGSSGVSHTAPALNSNVVGLGAAITEAVQKADVGIRQVFVTDQTEYMRRFEAIREEKRNKRPVDLMKLELFEAFTRLVPGHPGGNNPIPPQAP
jgi:YhcN/YlaJ family sporulation lipoprotein